MTIRDRINKLNAARKGSLFESFYVFILNKNNEVSFIRSGGVDVIITLNDGTQKEIDLKFWKTQPQPLPGSIRHWLNYFSKESIDSNTSKVISIQEGKNPEVIHEFSNELFEDYFLEWMRNRPTAEQVVTNSSQLRKRIAADFIREHFPESEYGRTRPMIRNYRSCYRVLTMAPELIPDNPRSQARIVSRFKRTILFVYSDDGTRFIEYWLIDHNELNEIESFLVDDGLKRNKKRIPGSNFPNHLKTTFDVLIT
jgi:hypothetical protein